MDNLLPITAEEEIATDMKMTSGDFASRMFNYKLAALRAQNPFVTITQWPSVMAFALTAGVAVDIDLPDGVKMILFSGNGEYFVTRNGRAQLPTGSHTQGDGALMNPEWGWIHAEEIRSISVIAPQDMRLSIAYIQQQ